MDINSTSINKGDLSATIIRANGTVEEVEFKPLLWPEKLKLDTLAFFRHILRILTSTF